MAMKTLPCHISTPVTDSGSNCEIAVIGAGVIGVTTAHWMSKLYDCSVVKLDKDNDAVLPTSLRNTGPVHRPCYLNPVKKRPLARSPGLPYHPWTQLASKFGLPWDEINTPKVAPKERLVASLEN
ncbi:MAG: FAD-binding oxidoreductase [Nitrososphaerales archaeon]|nr:FAD-binding oxidoreductase [Nitrososphaerales archaeon]